MKEKKLSLSRNFGYFWLSFSLEIAAQNLQPKAALKAFLSPAGNKKGGKWISLAIAREQQMTVLAGGRRDLNSTPPFPGNSGKQKGMSGKVWGRISKGKGG